MSTTEARVAENFKRDVADHQLTVLRNDGLYRHLRFRRPDRGEYWFDLVTWPGVLVINGDMGGHGFSRREDMFEFFRSKHGINPSYWAEKVVTGREGLKVYDEELFKEQVAEDLKEAEQDYPGVTDAWGAKVDGVWPDYYIGTEEDARAALEDFRYLPEFSKGEPFYFSDTGDWDLREYDYQYLWCCHAVQWGIRQYDNRPAPALWRRVTARLFGVGGES